MGAGRDEGRGIELSTCKIIKGLESREWSETGARETANIWTFKEDIYSTTDTDRHVLFMFLKWNDFVKFRLAGTTSFLLSGIYAGTIYARFRKAWTESDCTSLICMNAVESHFYFSTKLSEIWHLCSSAVSIWYHHCCRAMLPLYHNSEALTSPGIS